MDDFLIYWAGCSTWCILYSLIVVVPYHQMLVGFVAVLFRYFPQTILAACMIATGS